MIVLVNPVTKRPTAFAPSEGTPHIFSGPYQNVAEVSEEYVAQELQRVIRVCGDPGCGCARIRSGE